MYWKIVRLLKRLNYLIPVSLLFADALTKVIGDSSVVAFSLLVFSPVICSFRFTLDTKDVLCGLSESGDEFGAIVRNNRAWSPIRYIPVFDHSGGEIRSCCFLYRNYTYQFSIMVCNIDNKLILFARL